MSTIISAYSYPMLTISPLSICSILRYNLCVLKLLLYPVSHINRYFTITINLVDNVSLNFTDKSAIVYVIDKVQAHSGMSFYDGEICLQ